MPRRARKRDRLGHFLAAFELDRGAAGLGQHAGGGAERLLRRFLVAAERQVDRDQRVLGRAHDRGAMRDHHVERDRQGAVKAVDGHRQAVADQQQIDLVVEMPRDRRRIGRQADHLVAALAALDLRHRYALRPGLTLIARSPRRNDAGEDGSSAALRASPAVRRLR